MFIHILLPSVQKTIVQLSQLSRAVRLSAKSHKRDSPYCEKTEITLINVERQQILHSSLFTLHFFSYLCTTIKHLTLKSISIQ